MTYLKKYIKDIIIYLFVVALIIWAGYQFIYRDNSIFLDNIANYATKLIIIVFSFISVFEISYLVGFDILVPESYKNFKVNQQKKNISLYTEEYFKNEIDFIKTYDAERINYILSQMGISKSSYNRELLLNLIRIKSYKRNSNYDKQIEEIIKLNKVVMQEHDLPSGNLLNGVNYYINFYDVMNDEELSEILSNAIVYLICNNIAPDDLACAKIVVAYGSNFALASAVSKKLNKQIVHCFQNERIQTNRYWEGELNSQDKLIFVNDVLVTGTQFIESREKLPNSCTILGVICLIRRSEFDGKEQIIKEFGDECKVNTLLDLNDFQIESIIHTEK